ncbi:hypothetical protein [Tsukamurella soli]|uniref:Sulfur globule protein n=1 Tax=Tsukamurella soli TaxID=644556 RepID=A0ABP8K050_9ACTN
MNARKIAAGGVIGLGLAGAALGIGAGTANAAPVTPAASYWHPGPGGWGRPGWGGGYHAPVFWHGGWHQPIWNGYGWGFWLGPIWIPA